MKRLVNIIFLPRVGFLLCLRDKLITPVLETLFVIVLGVCFKRRLTTKYIPLGEP